MASYGPNLAVGDVIQVINVTRTTDQIGLNVFHYKVSVTPGTISLGTMVTALEAFGFGTAVRDLLSASAEYRGILSRRIFPTLSLQFGSTTDQGVGAVAGDLLPRQVSGLIKKLPAVAGKGKSGRFYIPFPGEADNAAASVPTAGYVTRLDTLRGMLINSLTGATWAADPCIVHRATKAPAPVTPFATWGITAMTSATLWATQRRRGSYGRTNASPL